jgi:hypothetical protein
MKAKKRTLHCVILAAVVLAWGGFFGYAFYRDHHYPDPLPAKAQFRQLLRDADGRWGEPHWYHYWQDKPFFTVAVPYGGELLVKVRFCGGDHYYVTISPTGDMGLEEVEERRVARGTVIDDAVRWSTWENGPPPPSGERERLFRQLAGDAAAALRRALGR